MGWSIGFDEHWQRDIGYGVPAYCDQPGCDAEIHRGLAFVCGGEPYGGERGCGLYFCAKHLFLQDAAYAHSEDVAQLCERCSDGQPPFEPKPDHPAWIRHKQTHPSWAEWRAEQEAQQ